MLLALAVEPIPQILILDEPLSGVDVGGEHLLLDMLDEIRQKYDLSILVIPITFKVRLLRHLLFQCRNCYTNGSIMSLKFFQ